FILQTGQFRLLETAADALHSYFFASSMIPEFQDALTAVDLVIRKPEALKGQAIPSLRTLRRKEDQPLLKSTATAFGRIDIIHSTPDSNLYQIVLHPHQKIALKTPPHRTLFEWVKFQERLLRDGHAVQPGKILEWKPSETHTLINEGTVPAPLILMERPGGPPLG